MPTMKRTLKALTVATGALVFSSTTNAQSNNSSKRGIAYHSAQHKSDYDLFLSDNSPITWYYNWSPYPSTNEIPANSIEFIPLIHGIDELDKDLQTLNSLPSSTTHLLTFNEPDGTTGSGGSSISPSDAAQAYIDHIVPLRDRFAISHPSVTGSGNGLEWLRSFNESCYDIAPDDGCPTDFVAAHWYGNFEGLASWLAQIHDFYDSDYRIWVTELALPQADDEATVQMMNQTLPYLDGLDYVERYSWFGMFRADDANEWTGDGVALLDDNGGLTELGSLYLGGEENGFSEGEKRGTGTLRRASLWSVSLTAMVVLSLTWLV